MRVGGRASGCVGQLAWKMLTGCRLRSQETRPVNLHLARRCLAEARARGRVDLWFILKHLVCGPRRAPEHTYIDDLLAREQGALVEAASMEHPQTRAVTAYMHQRQQLQLAKRSDIAATVAQVIISAPKPYQRTNDARVMRLLARRCNSSPRCCACSQAWPVSRYRCCAPSETHSG